MWALFVKGGPVMIPIAVLSVLGLAVTIEKLISLRASKVIQRDVVNAIESIRSPADIPMAIKFCERYTTPFANTVRVGLEEAGEPLPLVRQAMEDTGRREAKRLERYMVVLETVAAASPLLGLLGTVLGMIKVFSVISIAGVGQAGLLSGGIAEALLTTAFGLVVGIPALVAYNFLDSRIEALVIKVDTYAHVLLKQLSLMERAGAEARRETQG
jgi:biopolymer transport protein ExbB